MCGDCLVLFCKTSICDYTCWAYFLIILGYLGLLLNLTSGHTAASGNNTKFKEAFWFIYCFNNFQLDHNSKHKY